MNKHSSILWLMIQSSFWKVLALLAGTAAAQTVFFRQAVQQLQPGNYGLEQALAGGHVAGIAGIGFVCITVILCMTGAERANGKTIYTLQRLSVSERTVLLWQAVYNGSCYLLLWVSQVLVMMGLAQWYTRIADPSMVTSQTVFLAYYRNEYLHGLLPMLELDHWFRNGIMLVALGLSSAYFTYAQRRRQKNGELITMVLTVLWLFCDHINSEGEWLVSLISFICLSSVVKVLWKLKREEEAHEA